MKPAFSFRTVIRQRGEIYGPWHLFAFFPIVQAAHDIVTTEEVENMKLVLLPREHNDQEFFNSLALRMRDIRLRSLQTDPDSFSSVYASESKQPSEFWTKRLSNPTGRHFIITETKSTLERLTEDESLLSDDWKAILVVLGPQEINPENFDNATTWEVCLDRKRSLSGLDISTQKPGLAYHVVGVWVAPEARGKGYARQMIGGAIHAIQEDIYTKRATVAICTIGVAKNAIAARQLYLSSGFSVVAEDHPQTADGRNLEGFIMRQDIRMRSAEEEQTS